MTLTRRALRSAGVALLAGLAAAWCAHRGSGFPTAEPGHGSEDAFASGLHPREIVSRRGPIRWTRGEAAFAFVNLPPAPYALEVRIRGHQGAVVVKVDGAVVGEIPEGRFVGRFTLDSTPHSGAATVVLKPTAFRPEDPERGVLVDRVKLSYPAPGALPVAVALSFAVPSLCVFIAALLSGFAPAGAAGWAIGANLMHLAAIWPDGLLRSPYALLGGLEIALGASAAAWAVQAIRKTPRSLSRLAFTAVAVAAAVQIVAATHPLMVVSDAVFHANKLERLAGGEWLPTSQTQHARPFQFPYGVSFYTLLLPFEAAGLDRVGLVRFGAAIAAFAASVALVRSWGRAIGAGGVVAVVVLQLLPQTIDVHSFGNLSNIFGQAATVGFLVWWMGAARWSWLGATLLALAGTAHLSSLIVLIPVVAGIGLADRQHLRGQRLTAIVLGLGAVVLYYLPFAGLVASQLPRLLEGGGQGTTEISGFAGALRRQALSVVNDFGWPVVVAAGIGLLRRSWRSLPAAVRGYALGALTLAVPALVSPVEARYLFALAPIVAVLATFGAHELWTHGRTGRLVAGLLATAQGFLAWSRIVEAVLHRYRL